MFPKWMEISVDHNKTYCREFEFENPTDFASFRRVPPFLSASGFSTINQQAVNVECIPSLWGILLGFPHYFGTLTNEQSFTVSFCVSLGYAYGCHLLYVLPIDRMCYYPKQDPKQRHRNYLSNDLLIGCNTSLICSKHTICTL